MQPFQYRFLALLTIATATPITVLAQDGFVPLFNGQDLSGWQRVNTDERTWSVEDGMLVCSGKPIGELRTTQMYQNFILEVEWRHMVPKGNAGIFIWADDITAKGQPFHRSIEVQVLENAYGNNNSHTTHGDIFPIHGAKMTPINGRGGSRAFPTESRSKPSPEWNHYRIEAIDGNISLAVNGKVVTQGRDCNPRKGYICIESEGGVVHYRNLKIKVLPDQPIDDQLVAIADRGYQCLYTGIDLAGWQTDSPADWRANDWRLVYQGKSDQESTLMSTQRFDDFGFIIDVRLTPDSGVPVIDFGDPELQIKIDRRQPGWSDALDSPGRWNRMEGRLQGDQLSLSVNGNEILRQRISHKSRQSAPLRLRGDGPVEFANIYLREIDSN